MNIIAQDLIFLINTITSPYYAVRGVEEGVLEREMEWEEMFDFDDDKDS